jgi:hypothetical protein
VKCTILARRDGVEQRPVIQTESPPNYAAGAAGAIFLALALRPRSHSLLSSPLRSATEG